VVFDGSVLSIELKKRRTAYPFKCCSPIRAATGIVCTPVSFIETPIVTSLNVIVLVAFAQSLIFMSHKNKD